MLTGFGLDQVLREPAPTTLREWARQTIIVSVKPPQQENVWLSAISYMQWLNTLPTLR